MNNPASLTEWLTTTGDSRYRSVSTSRDGGQLRLLFKIAIFGRHSYRSSGPNQPEIEVGVYVTFAHAATMQPDEMRELFACLERWADAKLIDPDAEFVGRAA